MPTVVFSHPPIGTCGMTEPEAREHYGDDNIKVYKSKFTNLFFGHWQASPSHPHPILVVLAAIAARHAYWSREQPRFPVVRSGSTCVPIRVDGLIASTSA